MKIEDLKQYFELHCKPTATSNEGQMLGVEYETLIVIPDKESLEKNSYLPLPMDGEESIPIVLNNFKNIASFDNQDWEPLLEETHLIGLKNSNETSITIEPGGQIELSDRPRNNLDQVEWSIQQFVGFLNESLKEFRGRMLHLGVQPLWGLNQISLLPKKRYQIMFPYMKKAGSLGQWMMKGTAGTQLSLDYSSIDDLERKFRVICRLSPFLTALFANSPLHLGGPSGFKSFRNYIWQHTDEKRCGIPPSFIKPDFRIDDYIDWALEASPYHLKGKNGISDVIDFSFNDLIQGIHPEVVTDLNDWKDHIGMLFPEIRIKNIIEIRSMDTLPPDEVLAVYSMLKSLIYDEQNFEKLETILMDLPEEEFLWYQQVAARDGLEGQVNQTNFSKMGIKLIELALGTLSLPEGCRLNVFFERYTRHGISPADSVLERFYGAGEDALKWLELELDSSLEKEIAFLNFPCDFLETSLNIASN